MARGVSRCQRKQNGSEVMSKGYFGEETEAPKPEVKPPEKKRKGEAVGVAIGMTLGITAAICFEALLVWVILTYLMKAKLAYLQVVGGVVLFEYILGRTRVKK